MTTGKTIRAAKWGYVAASLVFCTAGILLIAFPGLSATALCYAAGGLLIACGIVKIAGYFSKDLYRLAFQFDLAYGILSVLVGLVMLLFPGRMLSILHFAVGVLILTDSLFKIQTAVDAKRFGLKQWGLIALFAVLTAALGLLLIINPFSGAVFMMILIGISFLFEGILNLFVAVCAVKVLRTPPAVIIETDYKEESQA